MRRSSSSKTLIPRASSSQASCSSSTSANSPRRVLSFLAACAITLSVSQAHAQEADLLKWGDSSYGGLFEFGQAPDDVMGGSVFSRVRPALATSVFGNRFYLDLQFELGLLFFDEPEDADDERSEDDEWRFNADLAAGIGVAIFEFGRSGTWATQARLTPLLGVGREHLYAAAQAQWVVVTPDDWAVEASAWWTPPATSYAWKSGESLDQKRLRLTVRASSLTLWAERRLADTHIAGPDRLAPTTDSTYQDLWRIGLGITMPFEF